MDTAQLGGDDQNVKQGSVVGVGLNVNKDTVEGGGNAVVDDNLNGKKGADEGGGNAVLDVNLIGKKGADEGGGKASNSISYPKTCLLIIGALVTFIIHDRWKVKAKLDWKATHLAEKKSWKARQRIANYSMVFLKAAAWKSMEKDIYSIEVSKKDDDRFGLKKICKAMVVKMFEIVTETVTKFLMSGRKN